MQPLLEVFDAQRFEKARHGVFRSRITRAAGQSVQPGDGRNADDRAFRRLQVGQCVFAAIDRTPEIDIHQLVQHVELHVVEDRAHRDPRVADQHVDAPELTDGGVDQLLAFGGLRHVHAAVSRPAARRADVARQKLQFLDAARPEHHLRALRGILLRHRLADARRSPCDDDDLIPECFHTVRLFRFPMCRKPDAPLREASSPSRHATRSRGTCA